MEEREYDYQGKKVKGHEIDIETAKEVWNIYKLADGTEVRVKTVIASIIRLNEYDATGNPVYLVNATPAIAMDVPASLKKKV